MKERPILFSAPMVRAILDGRKTQTRRVVKPAYVNDNGYWLREVVHGEAARKVTGPNDRAYVGFGHPSSASLLYFACPYGQPGDRLWVRETFVVEHQIESDQPPPHNDGRPVALGHGFGGTEWRQCHYRATDPVPDLMYEDHPRDEPHCRWRPSIHMPRWASRITLEITGVRVERLNEISEADARSEGCDAAFVGNRFAGYGTAFAQLWESINGAGSWDANPWVWVVEFRRLP